MIARWLYTAALALVSPLAFAWLRARARRQTGAPSPWRERRGEVKNASEAPVWIHAASLGEVQAAQALIDTWLERTSSQPVWVTTFSDTARAYAVKRFGTRVTVSLLPYDLPRYVARFLDRARPTLAIIVETEIWPNLYRALHRRTIPVVLVSARLSPRAFSRYRRIKALVAPALSRVRAIAAQTEADAKRFVSLGARAERVSVVGNIKLDTLLDDDVLARGKTLRDRIAFDRSMWVAGSTREGEEAVIIDAFTQVRAQHPKAQLVVAPRHPERAQAIAKQVPAAYSVVCYSAFEPTRQADIVIVDSVGLLLDFYAAADVVFVGGTLAEIGGHNILEPAMLARATVIGPHISNWQRLADAMVLDDGLAIADNAHDLAQIVVHWLSDRERRNGVGQRGEACALANRGALARVLAVIDALAG